MADNVLMAKSGVAVKLESAISLVPLAPSGQARLKVEKIALTVNVLSYAMSGESMGYFDFFPVDQVQCC
jgi:hypothetical protein